MPPLRIEITGESTIFCPPERAIVHVTIRSEGASQEQVIADVSGASNQIRVLYEGLAGRDAQGQVLAGAAVTHWSNSSLSTGSYWTYTDKGKVKNRSYNATMSFEAKFQDFSKLGSVTTTLSTMKHVKIDDVEWALTQKTRDEFQTQCRHAAMHDAVAKARDFATALDLPAPPVVEIKEGGSSPIYEVHGYRHNRSKSASNFPSSRVGHEDFNFQPEDVSIKCRVDVICLEK